MTLIRLSPVFQRILKKTPEQGWATSEKLPWAQKAEVPGKKRHRGNNHKKRT